MITALTLTVAHQPSSRDERIFRLRLRSEPGARITVSASGPHGWIETICTPQICAVRHTIVRIPASGTSVSLLHVYRTAPDSPVESVIDVRAAEAQMRRNVDFRNR